MGSEGSSGQRSPKCGFWTSSISISISWVLLGRQTLCPSPSPTEPDALGVGPSKLA